jgi:GDSL-like Lipase/Acylhydrolase.
MKKVDAKQIKEQGKLYGRTYMDETDKVLYFNWTCGGVEIEFTGTCLMADLIAWPDTRIEHIPGQTFGAIEDKAVSDWPWIGVVLDDEEELRQKILVDQPKKTVVLFASEKEEQHRIRIVKLNENFRTALGIQAFKMEGELRQRGEAKSRRKIEFIGDSITCGFGNMATEGNREFYTADENGWMTHGAITARKLDMDASFVSVSGITVARQGEIPAPYVMEELYPYTDRMIQDKLKQNKNYEPWNFKENQPDYIVLNLGTNDATGVMASDRPAAEEKAFEESYYRFIKTIRKLNGEKPRLICAMGSIDYYLFDRILQAVARVKKETGDNNIFCMKYTKMLTMGLDVGACFHPSVSRQAKMAEELTQFIRSLES